MKYILGVGAVLATAALTLWIMGYTVYFEKNRIGIKGPPRNSPNDAELEAKLPECFNLMGRYPEKEIYSAEEFEERTKAAEECYKAKIQHIKDNKEFR